MKCKKVKDLLLTNYIDGETSEELYIQLKEHLDRCKQCSQLESSLRRYAKEPFEEVDQVAVPENIWQEIKDTIEEEQLSKTWLQDVLDKLRNLTVVPKSVFAVATVVAVMLISVTFIKLLPDKNDLIGDYLYEQADFLSYLAGDSLEDFNGPADSGFGTAIEEYFL